MSDQEPLNTICFYCDPISPYAWLASTRLEEIETNTHANIIVKPILFAGLLKAHGNIGPAEITAKRVYTFRDVMRRAQDALKPAPSARSIDEAFVLHLGPVSDLVGLGCVQPALGQEAAAECAIRKQLDVGACAQRGQLRCGAAINQRE